MSTEIYKHSDYREFLREACQERKERDPRFSVRGLATRADVDHSLLAKVLSGQRHLAAPHLARLGVALGLDKEAVTYLETLADRSRARSDAERSRLDAKLATLRPHSREKIDASRHEYFRSWRHVAIRSLLDWYPFDGEDWDGLGRMLEPPVSGNLAIQSVDILLRLGLLVRDENSRFMPTQAHVSTGDRWHSRAVREFQKEVLALSESAIDRVPPEHRDISTLTVALPVSALEEIRTVIKEARAQIVRIADRYPSSASDAVCQLNIQLFPVTRWPREVAS